MKEIKNVYGSAQQAKPLIITSDTVYIHTDIQRVTIEATAEMDNPPELYQYNEIQYEKDEFLELIVNKNQELEDQITDTQLALTEIYEVLAADMDNNTDVESTDTDNTEDPEVLDAKN